MTRGSRKKGGYAVADSSLGGHDYGQIAKILSLEDNEPINYAMTRGTFLKTMETIATEISKHFDLDTSYETVSSLARNPDFQSAVGHVMLDDACSLSDKLSDE